MLTATSVSDRIEVSDFCRRSKTLFKRLKPIHSCLPLNIAMASGSLNFVAFRLLYLISSKNIASGSQQSPIRNAGHSIGAGV